MTVLRIVLFWFLAGFAGVTFEAGCDTLVQGAQTSLNILNMGLLDRVYIMPGPLSAVYGNASGGRVQTS